MIRRPLLATAVAFVALAPPGAYAGGMHDGTTGVVHDAVTVGGVTFAGSCQYRRTDVWPVVAGEATAAGPVLRTTVKCHLVQDGWSTWTWQTSTGPSSSFAGFSGPLDRVSWPVQTFCVQMWADLLDGSTVTTDEHCIQATP